MEQNMNRLFQIGFLLILILLIAACSNGDAQSVIPDSTPFPNSEVDTVAITPTKGAISLSNQKCYFTFEEFAYVLPDTYSREPLLPTEPWEIESIIPSEFIEDFPFPRLGYEVMVARNIDGNPEVWLTRPSRASRETIENILTYQPTSKEWRPISDTVAGTAVFISEVFMANDGTIWGINDWEGNIANPDKGPVLSKFNEHTQQFEFAQGVLEIPYTRDQQFVNIDFVVDRSGKIWIFVQDDGIYSYDPASQITNKHASLANVFVNTPVLSADGNFYFIDQHYSKMTRGNPPFRISEEMIFQFILDTGEVIPLETPDEPWPMTWGMFVTASEQLWLSAVGFIDLTDGSWHLAHPEPSRFFDNVGQDAWASPDPILESSNGLLWFNKYSGIYEGTAWYDLDTGEGCMFTNIPANIVEDPQQQLWMFADGKLYRYSLNG